MLSRRLATFLIGAWLGCTVLLGALILQSLSSPDQILLNLTEGARPLVMKIGDEDSRLLLRYQAAEQNRAYMSNWEIAQFVIAAVLAAILTLSTQRRLLPVFLVAGMLVVVVLQHFMLTPEITFLGRQSDFLADEAAYSVRSRLESLARVYAGAEALKFVVGGVLASYLFASASGTRTRKKRRSSEDAIGTER